ncbi:MAG: hypothetical protein K0Q49_582 [Haloplasmataceae bacterium]|jgi:hypothetical protein|nr:hypothetical protein [Haloplasmataceae bacterium]
MSILDKFIIEISLYFFSKKPKHNNDLNKKALIYI